MKRRLFDILALTSFALAVIVLTAWPYSFFYTDAWWVGKKGVAETAVISSYRGCVDVIYKVSRTDSVWFEHDIAPPGGWYWRPHYMASLGLIMAPYWMIFIVLSIVPAIWFYQQRLLRRRAKSGKCPSCGYDLRMSEGPCPECGWSSQASSNTSEWDRS